MTATCKTNRIPAAQLPTSHSCAVCFESKDTLLNPFIRHTGKNGKQHPIHYSCFKRALESNPQCPMCRVPMTNNLTGRADAIQHAAREARTNTDTAERQMATPMIMGAATIALMAAIELSGLKGAKDILAVGGGGYAMGALMFGAMYGTAGVEISWQKLAKFAAGGFATGALVGNELLNRGFTPPTASRLEVTGVFGACGAVIGAIASPFVGRGARADAGAENRITSTAQVTAAAGTAVGVVAWFLGKTQDSPLAQVFGIVAIARSTGLIPLATGASIGAVTAGAIRFGEWFGKRAEEATAAAASSMTAVVLNSKNNPTCPVPQGIGISAAATRFGMTAAKVFAKMGFRNLDRTQSLVAAGMVAALAAAAGSTLLSRAYQSYQRSRAPGALAAA